MNIAAADAFMAIFGLKRVEEEKDEMSTQTGIKPVASRDDIIQRFVELIDAKGETTTLEVKESLRADGFWALQSDVSLAIASMVDGDGDEGDYTYDIDRRGYRVYREIGSRTRIAPKASATISVWSVTDGATSAVYAQMTRNQARYRFSQTYGVPYINVRATLA